MNTLTKIRRLPRAMRVSHERRKARDAAHIAWAHSLLGADEHGERLVRSNRRLLPTAGQCNRCGHNVTSYGHYTECGTDDDYEPYPVEPQRLPAGWSEDPIDGFPYPPV